MYAGIQVAPYVDKELCQSQGEINLACSRHLPFPGSKQPRVEKWGKKLRSRSLSSPALTEEMKGFGVGESQDVFVSPKRSLLRV